MENLRFLDVAAAVLLGNVLAMLLFWCLKTIERTEKERGISGVNGWALAGVIMIALFLLSSLYLTSQH